MTITHVYIPSFHYPKAPLSPEMLEIEKEYLRLTASLLLNADVEASATLDAEIDALIERRNALFSG